MHRRNPARAPSPAGVPRKSHAQAVAQAPANTTARLAAEDDQINLAGLAALPPTTVLSSMRGLIVDACVVWVESRCLCPRSSCLGN